MKKFRFNLEPVLRKRKLAYENCARELAAVVSKLQLEQQKLNGIQRKKSETISEFERKNNPTTKDFVIYVPYIDQLELMGIRQLAAVKEVEAEVESAREVLRQAQIEHEVLVRMKEKLREQHEYEARVEEQKFLDEIAGSRSAKDPQ